MRSMKLLGLMMVRNGADRVTLALDGMQGFCDEVYVVDDRSTDQTLPLLLRHPVVKNVFHVDPAISHQDWFFPESMGLNLLYRMADFSRPDWVIFLDDDQAVESPNELRTILSEVPSSVAALLTPMVSSWADPDYPLLVPLMGRATSVQGNIWRYFPGLESGSKPVHNGHLPVNIERFGRIERVDGITLVHDGWNTLRQRIAKVDLYQTLDPDGTYNFGVPYDEGLLFGYKRGALKDLLREYRRRFAHHEACLSRGEQA
jgi:glycosyltransferase involved in cell wall biosynthesis